MDLQSNDISCLDPTGAQEYGALLSLSLASNCLTALPAATEQVLVLCGC